MRCFRYAFGLCLPNLFRTPSFPTIFRTIRRASVLSPSIPRYPIPDEQPDEVPPDAASRVRRDAMLPSTARGRARSATARRRRPRLDRDSSGHSSTHQPPLRVRPDPLGRGSHPREPPPTTTGAPARPRRQQREDLAALARHHDRVLEVRRQALVRVTAVQPSDSTFTAGLPALTIGSIASTMPSDSRGPCPAGP